MKTKIEREREHHAHLDALAAKCNELAQAGATHLGCAYCAHLANYYTRQRDAGNGILR